MGWAFLACAPSKPHFVLSDILALLFIHQYSDSKLYRLAVLYTASSHASLSPFLFLMLLHKMLSLRFMQIYFLTFLWKSYTFLFSILFFSSACLLTVYISFGKVEAVCWDSHNSVSWMFPLRSHHVPAMFLSRLQPVVSYPSSHRLAAVFFFLYL